MATVFLHLLSMSLIASYCIVIVLLIRLLLRKSPKIFSYLLWIAVFARLAFPMMPESPVSFVPRSFGSQSVVSWIDPERARGADPSALLISEPITSVADAISDPENASLPDPSIAQGSTGKTDSPEALSPANLTDVPDMADSKGSSRLSILSTIWLSGLFALITYNLIVYIRLSRRLRSAIHIDGIVYESSSVSSPFMLGLFRPRIYLPLNLQDTDRTYILRHEQVHLRRFDYAVKAILFAITCVHWFNPLVWLAFGLMSRDMEMSCDEKVVRELGYDIKKNYSFSLLSLATGRSQLHATPLAFGEGNIKGRIKNILNYKKPALWILLGSAALVGVVAIGLILNPLQRENEKGTDATAETTSAESTPETSAEWTQATPPSSPSETQLVLDERYDELFIEVDGDQISFREVLSYYGEYHPFSYASPLDYETVTPVDLNNFETVFADEGYKVSDHEGIANGSLISGWKAESPDGMDIVVCSNFPSEEAAKLFVTQYAMHWYYKFAQKSSEQAWPALGCLYTDSALLIYDELNLAGDNIFQIFFLSGKSVIHGKIQVEVSRLSTFFATMDALGLPFPKTLNQNESTWPEKAVLDSSEDFVEYMTDRGYIAYESQNVEGLFHAESGDLNFQANYRSLNNDNRDIDWDYLWNVLGPECTYLDHYSTDTYQMLVLGSPRDYIVRVYINDVVIDAWVNINDLTESEAYAMREKVDTVILDLCFS